MSATAWDVTNAQPSANWRPGQRRMRERKSVAHTIRHGIRSMLRSVARRGDFDVPDLAELAGLADELDAALAVAVANLREQGHTWQTIGDALGVSRQAAFRKYATVPERRGELDSWTVEAWR